MNYVISNLTLLGTYNYVADGGNGRVQVLDTSGQFVRAFGQEGEGKLSEPSGLYIVDK